MSELAALAQPRPLLITFTNGAQADFVKARRIPLESIVEILSPWLTITFTFTWKPE